jgi:AcrR family transcriptional regulator
MAAATASRREARREERRSAILALARSHFNEHGYGGMTMSALACALGGSKSTLWAYFSSKEELFAAVMDDLVEQFAPAIALDVAEEPASMLLRYAADFLTMMLSPQIIALNRLVIAEASRFPELGRMFYERGPECRHRQLAGYFAAQIARGHMRSVDPLVASAQFHHLCQAGLFIRTMWGISAGGDAAAIRQDAERSVALFLAGYGEPAGGVAPAG